MLGPGSWLLWGTAWVLEGSGEDMCLKLWGKGLPEWWEPLASAHEIDKEGKYFTNVPSGISREFSHMVHFRVRTERVKINRRGSMRVQ